jgi:hypothetical protein
MKKIHKWRLLKRDTCLRVLISALLLFCMVSAVQAAPAADFIGEPASGPVPLIVWFTDNSAGNLTGWGWDFGDGFGSTLANPAHVYLFAGSYDVALTVSGDGDSDTVVKEDHITAQVPEIPLYYNADPSQIPGSLVVNKFYAETDPESGEFLAEFHAFPTNLGDNPEFVWDFEGDGSPDFQTSVPETTHSYGPGIYEPEVKVTSDGVTPYDLELPTYLIVISQGTDNLDDLIEKGVE